MATFYPQQQEQPQYHPQYQYQYQYPQHVLQEKNSSAYVTLDAPPVGEKPPSEILQLHTILKALVTLLLTFSTSPTGGPQRQCEIHKRLQAVDSPDHNVGTYSCVNPRAHWTSGIHNPSLAHQ
jgi:hypothetical protein